MSSLTNNFKFFIGKKINLPTQGMFNTLVNHQRTPQRYTYMYGSSIPRNEIPDEIYRYIIYDIERRLHQLVGTDLININHEIINQDENGFRIRSETFY
jgi:hypothetical protein